MSLPIENYALIGDLRTAALVSRRGSIDWLCLPRFDSPACLAALLGSDVNGRWLLAPSNEVLGIRRRYLGETLILETQFDTDSGSCIVTDFMPPRKQNDSAVLIRIVRGISGSVNLSSDLCLRFDYGRIKPHISETPDSFVATAAPHRIELRAPGDVRCNNFGAICNFTVRQGQELPFVMMWSPVHEDAPSVPDGFTDSFKTARCSMMRSLISFRS